MPVLFLVFSSLALANGQSTHIWISLHALEHVPEGELLDLLSAPEQREALINGSMFPDGGYAFGKPYGEASHWEGFQNRYLEYVRDQYGAPWSPEGKQRVAYIMGMASHGMADQVFDAMYMERAKQVYDANADWSVSMDEATDAVFVSLVGPQPLVPAWIPPEFPERFADIGIETTTGELSQGQAALGIAVTYISNVGQDPDQLETYRLQFPWATSHLMESVPGAPPCEGEIIAKYWQHMWARLQGDEQLELGPIATVPDPGHYGHPLLASDIDSMVSVVMPRGLSSVSPGDFEVIGPDGEPHPMQEPWLFYNSGSHVVNLRPAEDWLPESDYRIRVRAGMQSFDGMTLGGPWELPFHTRATPPGMDPEPDASACGCAQGTLMSWTWLGLLLWGIRRRR